MRDKRHCRRGCGAAAALVALLLLAGCAAAVRTHGVAHATTSELVPWIEAAAEFALPGTSAPPSPPADARPCRSSDLSASGEPGSGAGGHFFTFVRFRNVSSTPCLLAGYPEVTATAPGRPDVVGTPSRFYPPGQSDNMPSGAANTLLALETDTYCAARPGGGGGGDFYRHVDIELPGGGSVSLTVPGGSLDVTCGLHLSPFFDPDYPQPEPDRPLAVLTAALVLPPTAEAGRTLDYEVVLHNPTAKPVALRPCPAYIESAAGPTPVKETYALNCAPVGAIAPGRTVRFAMRLRLPADAPVGPLTIRWALNTPAPPAAGTVVVVRH